jgi:hypothetical protein
MAESSVPATENTTEHETTAASIYTEPETTIPETVTFIEPKTEPVTTATLTEAPDTGVNSNVSIQVLVIVFGLTGCIAIIIRNAKCGMRN